MATMILQVIFFNTLVSVIGNHYEDRFEKREQYANMQRNSLYQDFINSLQIREMKKYMWVMEPSVETQLDDGQETMVQTIKKGIESYKELIDTQNA